MLLKIYTNNSGLDTKSVDFIDPSFDLSAFDPRIAHTVEEWQNYFFSVNPECEIADSMPNAVLRNNLHTAAFLEYLRKKSAKGHIRGWNPLKRPSKGFGK